MSCDAAWHAGGGEQSTRREYLYRNQAPATPGGPATGAAGSTSTETLGKNTGPPPESSTHFQQRYPGRSSLR
ncbi:MAG: hypothetical protein ABI920_11015 [Casimicrobiaceae bacterium]